jgi:amidase
MVSFHRVFAADNTISIAKRALSAGIAVVVLLTLSISSSGQDQSPTTFQLEETTIAEIHAAFKARTLTCRQLISQYLDRIDAYSYSGPKLNAVSSVNPKALEIADALDAQWQRSGPAGPLHCIPVLLKDEINTADMPTTLGSAVLRNAIPRNDAFLVKRLKEAGAIILGKNVMSDLAGGSHTLQGTPRNPYNIIRSPGGSSTGSGVSVAANFTVLSVGEDTLTSVRTPAAVTGIVGLRPTTGLISRSGMQPRKKNIDTAGPMARTVTDATILLNALAGPDPTDPKSLETFQSYSSADKNGDGYADFTRFLKRGALKGTRIGIGRDYFGGDPEIDALAEAAIKTFQELGATTVDVRFPPDWFEKYVRNGIQNLTLILMYPFREHFEAYLRESFGPGVPKTVEEWVKIYDNDLMKSPFPPEPGGASSAPTVLKASLQHSADEPEYQDLITNVLPPLVKQKLALFNEARVDAIIMPYQPAFAGPLRTSTEQHTDPKYVAAPGRSSPNNIAGYGSIGFPMVVVPMGFGTQGLPMGLAIWGRPYDDGRILGYAYDYEQATKLRRPSPLVPPLSRPTGQSSPASGR